MLIIDALLIGAFFETKFEDELATDPKFPSRVMWGEVAVLQLESWGSFYILDGTVALRDSPLSGLSGTIYDGFC